MKPFWNLTRLSIAATALSLGAFSQSLTAQELEATPRYGEAELIAGYVDDPHSISIQTGGLDEAPDLDGICSGYIFNSAPDYNVVYDASGQPLSVLVVSDSDTTLLVNDALGRWHCNDDSRFAGGSNPAITFDEAESGTYNIWVGSYEQGSVDQANILVTEYASAQWADFIETPSTGGSSTTIGGIEFGDDTSSWANDGECDDPRFTGTGAAVTTLPEEAFHDATDCSELFMDGSITLIAQTPAADIDFGDDASIWANDGECDDPRFGVSGVSSSLSDDDRMHDASDCSNLYTAGSIVLLEVDPAITLLALMFGDDSGTYPNDGECDDSRFEGPGVASGMSDEDRFRDATDCGELFQQGEITLIPISSGGPGGAIASGEVVSGSLSNGDQQRSNNAYADNYSFEGRAGDVLSLDLRSTAFDTLLMVLSPDGTEFENDDFSGSTERSVLEIDLVETGTYKVIVSSFSDGEVGRYKLGVR